MLISIHKCQYAEIVQLIPLENTNVVVDIIKYWKVVLLE